MNSIIALFLGVTSASKSLNQQETCTLDTITETVPLTPMPVDQLEQVDPVGEIDDLPITTGEEFDIPSPNSFVQSGPVLGVCSS